MSHFSTSGLRNQPSAEMLNFLKNFEVENRKDEYSVDEFFTFLEFLPLEDTTKLTLDERAEKESNHRIMVAYLREKLTDGNKRKEFTVNDLMRILERDTVDPKLLTDICERENKEDVLNTVGAFIKEQVDEKGRFQSILNFLKTFIKEDN